jgi:hypothetical protein
MMMSKKLKNLRGRGQRFSGGIFRFPRSNEENFSISTGFKYSSTFGGNLPSFPFGRTGRFSKPPPQLGHTLYRMLLTQSAQNVHSKEQIIASALSGGKIFPQFSQMGRSSNMLFSFYNLL